MGKPTLKNGDKFGKLTVVNFDNTRKAWLCECECGNKTYSRAWSLKNGRHKSCFCGQKTERPDRRLPENTSLKREMLHNYKQAAKRRGYIFELSEEQFSQLIAGKCHYCDAEPSQLKWSQYSNRDFKCNGVDRIDNSLGYIASNCVSCCAICNMSKRKLTTQEWLEWLKRIYKKQFGDKCELS